MVGTSWNKAIFVKKQEETTSLSVQIIHLAQILGSHLILASCTSYLWEKPPLLIWKRKKEPLWNTLLQSLPMPFHTERLHIVLHYLGCTWERKCCVIFFVFVAFRIFCGSMKHVHQSDFNFERAFHLGPLSHLVSEWRSRPPSPSNSWYLTRQQSSTYIRWRENFDLHLPWKHLLRCKSREQGQMVTSRSSDHELPAGQNHKTSEQLTWRNL